MAMRDDLTFHGYTFGSVQDVELAKSEWQKIEYLESKMPFQDAEKMRGIYERLIETKSFRTPIGNDFLMHIRSDLLSKGYSEDELTSVPLYTVYTFDEGDKIKPARERIRVKKKKDKDKERQRFLYSVYLNIILVILVIILFYITVNSSQPNILNYEKAITNKYSAWEQDLSEREKELRRREKAAGIQFDKDTFSDSQNEHISDE